VGAEGSGTQQPTDTFYKNAKERLTRHRQRRRKQAIVQSGETWECHCGWKCSVTCRGTIQPGVQSSRCDGGSAGEKSLYNEGYRVEVRQGRKTHALKRGCPSACCRQVRRVPLLLQKSDGLGAIPPTWRYKRLQSHQVDRMLSERGSL
jgi:hypothetical protein